MWTGMQLNRKWDWEIEIYWNERGWSFSKEKEEKEQLSEEKGTLRCMYVLVV